MLALILRTKESRKSGEKARKISIPHTEIKMGAESPVSIVMKLRKIGIDNEETAAQLMSFR